LRADWALKGTTKNTKGTKKSDKTKPRAIEPHDDAGKRHGPSRQDRGGEEEPNSGVATLITMIADDGTERSPRI
jgi:hypothetical protein